MFRPAPFAAVAAALALAGPAAAQQLAQDKLDAIKRATVLVKVSTGAAAGSGSGFLVRAADSHTGYVVTNHHVIDFGHGTKAQHKPGEPREEFIEVVFNSGTAEESALKTEVVAEDPERDLAVLKVKSRKPLPKPLDLSSPPRLVETLPVLVCGFPFGESLSTNARNPAITIGKATISSVRTNSAGDPVYVQLDGAVNPGNSGGPIVTADGKLVGVAVMTIRGAGIGLAIPHQEVATLLAGRLGASSLYATPVDADAVQVKIDVPLIDPFRQIGRVKVWYALAGSGEKPPQTDKSGQWARIPGAAGMDLAVRNGIAETSVRLPRNAKPSLWLQFEFTTRNGTTYLLGTTEHTMPSFRPTDGVGQGIFLTASRVAADDKLAGKGGVSLRGLNTRPTQYVGTKVTLEGVVTGAVKRDGPQPELTVMFDKQTKAVNLKFTASASLADQVEKAVGKDGTPTAARVVGTVFAPEGADQRCVVEIEEIRLLGEDGAVTASLKPVANVTPVKANPVTPSAPPPSTPAAAEPAATHEKSAGLPEGVPPLPVLIAGGVALVLAGVGAGILVARRGRHKSAPFPPPSQARGSSVLETPAPGTATPPPVDRDAARRVRF